MGFLDDAWDGLCDNVICPAGSLLAKGIEGTASVVVDVVETTGRALEPIGKGLDCVVDAVKEHPVEAAFVAGTAVVTGGSSLLVNAGVSGLVAAGSSTVGLGVATAGTVATIETIVTTSTAGSTIISSALGGHVAMNIGQSFIDNVILDKVHPTRGCVVYCDLAMAAEHSGIYVGDGRIVHLDGSGKIEMVSAEEFIGRLGGLNPALSIYVSCDDDGATGSKRAAQRACAALGGKRNYNVILDNCHQFSSGCLTGSFDNADNFLWMLKHTAEQKINVTKWRVWERG